MISLGLACGWVILAHVIAFLPSRDRHWRASYGLIALGMPILVFVWIENGWLIAALVLAGAMSILRWPVIYFYRWLRRVIGLPVKGHE